MPDTMKNTVIVEPTWVKVSPKSRMSHGKSVGSTKWKKCDVPWQKPTREITAASCLKLGAGAEAADIGSILPNLTRVNRRQRFSALDLPPQTGFPTRPHVF